MNEFANLKRVSEWAALHGYRIFLPSPLVNFDLHRKSEFKHVSIQPHAFNDRVRFWILDFGFWILDFVRIPVEGDLWFFAPTRQPQRESEMCRALRGNLKSN